ncbi:MAG: VOC family protein [Myxococcales bacterium FL481]|nr:MAG: VOC family protein [Myxococcales bacterium FL481]
MNLGNFSVSLAVRDLAASRAFYETLGFAPMAGDASQNWLILCNGPVKIGLFQGLFEANLLTFNPGWDEAGEALEAFTDVREIQARLEAEGIEPTTRVEAGSSGPGHFSVVDPDGNQILFDQHV